MHCAGGHWHCFFELLRNSQHWRLDIFWPWPLWLILSHFPNYDAHFCDGLWPFKTQNRQIFQDWGYCLVSNKARRDSTSVILFQTTRWVRRDCQTEIDRQHRLLFSMPPVPVMMTLQHKVPVSSKISFQNVPDINVTISFCSFWLFKPSSQLFEPRQVQSLLDVWNGKICLIMLVLF